MGVGGGVDMQLGAASLIQSWVTAGSPVPAWTVVCRGSHQSSQTKFSEIFSETERQCDHQFQKITDIQCGDRCTTFPQQLTTAQSILAENASSLWSGPVHQYVVLILFGFLCA